MKWVSRLTITGVEILIEEDEVVLHLWRETERERETPAAITGDRRVVGCESERLSEWESLGHTWAAVLPIFEVRYDL